MIVFVHPSFHPHHCLPLQAVVLRSVSAVWSEGHIHHRPYKKRPNTRLKLPVSVHDFIEVDARRLCIREKEMIKISTKAYFLLHECELLHCH